MSMDYFVYIRQRQDFIADECVDYLYQKAGLKIEFDPDFEVSDQTGFLPISLSMDDGQSPISSGFELSISDIRFTDDPDRIDDSIWLYEQDFRNAYGDTFFSYTCQFSFSTQNANETLLVFAVSAYLIECCNGLLFDPQEGRSYAKQELNAVFDQMHLVKGDLHDMAPETNSHKTVKSSPPKKTVTWKSCRAVLLSLVIHIIFLMILQSNNPEWILTASTFISAVLHLANIGYCIFQMTRCQKGQQLFNTLVFIVAILLILLISFPLLPLILYITGNIGY